MHSLAHLVDSIKRRGVTSNCSTDQGEALHPQNKKHWARSNQQASAPEQVGYIFSYPTFNLTPLFRCYIWELSQKSFAKSAIKLITMMSSRCPTQEKGFQLPTTCPIVLPRHQPHHNQYIQYHPPAGTWDHRLPQLTLIVFWEE